MPWRHEGHPRMRHSLTRSNLPLPIVWSEPTILPRAILNRMLPKAPHATVTILTTLS